MAYVVTAQYKQAEAAYQVAGKPNRCIATLLYYTGPQQSRPPRRFVILGAKANKSRLTEDVWQSLAQSRQQLTADPLFPEKKDRTTLLDNLV